MSCLTYRHISDSYKLKFIDDIISPVSIYLELTKHCLKLWRGTSLVLTHKIFRNPIIKCSTHIIQFFIYLGFYITFNTVQVISRWIVLGTEETRTYSWSRFCTVNCRQNGKQLEAFPLEVQPGIELRSQSWEARVLPLCHRGLPTHIIHEASVYSRESSGSS